MTKMGWATFWATFSQTRQVALGRRACARIIVSLGLVSMKNPTQAPMVSRRHGLKIMEPFKKL
jgi:hypothetical protein